jgi:hypothetical protein
MSVGAPTHHASVCVTVRGAQFTTPHPTLQTRCCCVACSPSAHDSSVIIEHMCMAKSARRMSTLAAVVEHTCELYPEPFGMVAHTRSLLSSVPLNPKLRHFKSVISQDDSAHKRLDLT